MLDNHSCCGAMADIGDLPQLGSEPVRPGPDYPFPKRKLVNKQLWSALVKTYILDHGLGSPTRSPKTRCCHELPS